MQLTYTTIFKYSDRLNPVSSMSLFLAGKLAELSPEKALLDLGSGKGFPSLLWASAFGVRVDGFEINREYVKYANSHAKLLNLEHLAKYYCRDIKQLKPTHKYDAVASLGLGITGIYGSAEIALKKIRQMLGSHGFLILAEPAWLTRPIPRKLQEQLEMPEESLCTKVEMEHLLEGCGFEVKTCLVSTKEDWELYVRPANLAMQEAMKSQPELSKECQAVMRGFQAECEAVETYWNMMLWVAETS